MRYAKVKSDKAARKARREARRTAERQLRETMSPQRIREAAKTLAAHDPKFAKHLEAKASALLQRDKERRIPSLATVDPEVLRQANASRAAVLAKAIVCRRGAHVWRVLRSAVPAVKDSDGKVVAEARSALVEYKHYESVSKARKAAGLGAVVIEDREQLPVQFKIGS